MCDKVVSTYPYTMQFVPDHFKTEEMCDKAVDTCPFYLILLLIDMNSRNVW